MINQRSVDYARPALAFVASVSNRVIARKLEREQKKKLIPFTFALAPTFLDELARKRLLRRLVWHMPT